MHDPDVTAISQALDQEIKALQAMLAILQVEYDALEARDTGQLARSSEQKQLCIENVRMSTAARAHLANAPSPDNAADGLQSRWQKLAELAGHCREMNERNGLMIRWQHRYTSEALAVLANDSSNVRLYGADGAADRITLRRGSLGIA